ncbi:MAG: hypothetical protein LKI39_02585 [Bacteroides sp.]|jgi:hypothetical protein|nr:hypothetical protein [Bacteroides sp.]
MEKNEDYLREEKADTRVNHPKVEQLMRAQREKEKGMRMLRINPTTAILVPPEKNKAEYAVKYREQIERRNGAD